MAEGNTEAGLERREAPVSTPPPPEEAPAPKPNAGQDAPSGSQGC